MIFTALSLAAKAQGLTILGVVAPKHKIALLGPGAGFWAQFSKAREYQDNRPDPIDRWSTRIITKLATECDAIAHLPFGGPPYAPFFDWALACNNMWQSPLGMLVHHQKGLMVSFRGALEFSAPLKDYPTRAPKNPCKSCASKPCLTACPVEAFAHDIYDVARCRSYLHTAAGAPCLNGGCQARLACPLSDSADRPDALNRLYMRAFRAGA